MSPAPHDKSNNSPDFGANDWLIEEMRDQYQSDPNSVDPAWATFFRKEAVESTDSVTKSAAKDVPGASAPSLRRSRSLFLLRNPRPSQPRSPKAASASSNVRRRTAT